MEKLKTGAKNETGVVVKIEKSLKEATTRNPEGTLLSECKCPYFSNKYCVAKGYKDCRSKKYVWKVERIERWNCEGN